ncbi:hypothetical protein [Psychrobacter sp. NPDC078501]|jgi:hypothetical protein|uniref:hypothetical protein n=1 Tax=Psychrobacter sp. NPDC078501 TaxID=3364495 RepID=UPI0038514709
MKKLFLTKSIQSKLWIVFMVSFFGLSACSSETEEPAPNTESSEMTPVQTATEAEDQIPASTEDAEGAGGTAYYSSNGSVENEQKADDTVTVNENNSNLDQTSADGVQ